MFAFGRADRAKTSATFREILDAMWLFNEKFERALAEYDEIRKQGKGLKTLAEAGSERTEHRPSRLAIYPSSPPRHRC